MLKKAIVILLLFFYGSATMGASVHLHYCMDKFVGASFFHDNDEECGKCGMKEKKDGCCKDEHKQIKLSADQNKTAATLFAHFIASPIIGNPIFEYNPIAFGRIAENLPACNAPPDPDKVRLHVLNCVFLI